MTQLNTLFMLDLNHAIVDCLRTSEVSKILCYRNNNGTNDNKDD